MKQSRQKHSAAFKAKVALAALKGGWRTGQRVWCPSQPDPCLEEGAARRCGRRVRERQRPGGQDQRNPGRRTLPPDRSVEGRKRFFGPEARQGSRAERRAMIDRAHPTLSVSRQCQLLEVSRASVYRRPAPVNAEDLRLMELIDRQYLARPFYGSRRMAAWLATQGFPVNRKRVQRLMRLMGLVAIYQRPNTSKAAPEHTKYPYLLGGLTIDRVNQV